MKTEVFGIKNLAILDPVSLAVAYQKIYSTAPWGEWKKCSNHSCDHHWGFEQHEELEKLHFRHCGLPVQDYWPNDWLYNEFKRLSDSPGFTATVAYNINLGKMIGFCWGYQLELGQLDDKFELIGVDNKAREKIVDSKPLIYLSDVAVDLDYRQRGVARSLVNLYFEQNRHNGWVMIRTKGGEEPSVTNSWFYRLGFNLLLKYDDGRNLELQLNKISNLVEEH